MKQYACNSQNISEGGKFLNAPGNLVDYAFEVAKIQNSLTGELRGPNFTIDNANDFPAAFEEAWAAVVAMLKEINK